MITYPSKITPLLLILLYTIHLPGQSPCGFDAVREELISLDPGWKDVLIEQEKQIRKLISTGHTQQRSGIVYSIPVVVHVIYASPDAPHNISDAQIQSGIERLNEVFSDVNGHGLSANIEFCLAGRDPDCNPTTGINRVNGSVIPDYASEGIDFEVNDTDGKGASRTAVTGLSRWNPEKYLNIWVVNEISDNNAGAGIQAYASLPGTSFLYDGIVILFNAFGYDYDQCSCFELKSYTDENEVLAHETGHYLGLYHTFEGDAYGSTCPGNSETEGDRVTDTPAHKRTFACASGQNECYDPSHEFANWSKIAHNYMGYAPESCQFEFTQGQVDRMRAALFNSRYALIHSIGCSDHEPVSLNATECQPQTQDGLSAEYGMGIVQVRIGSMVTGSGSSFQDGGYLQSSCDRVILEPGITYDVHIETFGFYNENVRVFIDFNNNGSMTSDELVFSSDNTYLHKGAFTTPEEVLTGEPLRMRIISDHFQYQINGSCYQPRYGQVEDYPVIFPEANTGYYERGMAVSMDGVDDFLVSNVVTELAEDSYTIEFWCRPEGDPANCQILFDKTMNNFSSLHFMILWHGRVFVYNGRELMFLDPYFRIDYNEWHHFAYTWDGQVQKMYVNGILRGRDTVTQVIANDAPFRFGSFFGAYLYFKGKMDECRIWPYARTDAEIRENMFLAAKSIGSAAIYFNFNQYAPDSTWQDISANYAFARQGGAGLVQSSVNSGYDGLSHTKTKVMTGDSCEFGLTGLVLNILEKTDTSDMTVVKPLFNPNTLAGVTAMEVFDGQTWILTQSEDVIFSATATFSMPGHDFTGLSPASFQLYHRSVGSDGNWELLLPEAESVDGPTVTFSNIQSTGQYMVAKI